MRKQSHILLAKYLIEQLEEVTGLQEHKKAFCFGSILPDIRLSFITTRHEFTGTFEDIKAKMHFLVECDPKECMERAYWRRLGEVLHYVADYFTFPHNKGYTENFFAHNKYEKHLKEKLEESIECGKAALYTNKEIQFETFTHLIEYLKTRHENYEKKIRNVSEDIIYILTTCYQVLQGIFYLCTGINIRTMVTVA